MALRQASSGSSPVRGDWSKNSGIFWSTKSGVSYIGHGGSDLGVSAEMLSTLDKDVAITLMVNTSLSGKEAAVNTALR